MRLLILTMFAVAACAQSRNGVITGVVTDRTGAPVKSAPVQAANAATGAAIRGFSTAKGDYTLAQVPAGKYVVSVIMPGFSFLPFVRSDVAVQPGQTMRLNIALPEGPSLGTLGDDPERSRTKTPPPAGPAPRTPAGKPDFSGVWQGNDDPFPDQPELLPAVAARAKHMLETEGKDHPGARCLPQGAVLNGPFSIASCKTAMFCSRFSRMFPAIARSIWTAAPIRRSPTPLGWDIPPESGKATRWSSTRWVSTSMAGSVSIRPPRNCT